MCKLLSDGGFSVVFGYNNAFCCPTKQNTAFAQNQAGPLKVKKELLHPTEENWTLIVDDEYVSWIQVEVLL